jgi:hypothetical protein
MPLKLAAIEKLTSSYAIPSAMDPNHPFPIQASYVKIIITLIVISYQILSYYR